tara:strand:- start:650 stop:793 length:144 start_codon:yes stop_codon:yes gene_type:complete
MLEMINQNPKGLTKLLPKFEEQKLKEKPKMTLANPCEIYNSCYIILF